MAVHAPRRAAARLPPQLLAGAGLALAAVLALLAAQRLGAAAVLVGVTAAVAAIVLLDRPAAVVGLMLLLVTVFERDHAALIHDPGRLYDYLPGLKITGVEALAGLSAAAVLVRAAARRRLWLPAPFTPALLLVLVAAVVGAVTGLAAGTGLKTVIEGARGLALLALVPLLVVNVVTTRAALRHWIAGLAVLAILKAGVGLAALAVGSGTQILEGSKGTYLESTTNLLSLLFLAGAAAAALGRVPMPRWVWWGVPVVAASLTLSYRRSFWIAAAAALVIVLVVGSGRVGRRLLVPAVVVIAVLGWLLVGTGVGGQLDGVVVQRVSSLAPAKLGRDAQDRYRIAERENVVRDLREHPIAGLGIGQGWTARTPLPLEHPEGRQYVHFAVLWWWMTCGVLGLLAYVAVFATTVAAGLRLARRDPDARLRAVALGTAAAMAGLALAELTATFTGAETRATVLIGAVMGLLAAAWRTTAAAPPP